MRKIYAIAAFLLLGAAAMQAQPVAHQAGVAKGNEFKAEMMEPENAGDAVVATEAERAAMSLKAAPSTGEAYYYRPAGTFFVGTAATTTYSQYAPYLVVSPYKTYTFKADPAFTRQLSDIGTDLVTLANNHTYDYLEQGLLDTLDSLKAAGIPTIGAGRNLSEAEAPYYAKAGNTTLAIISTTRIEGYQNPPTRGATSTSAGVFRCLDPTELLRVVKEAKTKADLVIVYVHWGTEKRATPDANQLALAKQLEAAGCDAVIGDHSHCLETLGYVIDMPVVYSLGNYLFSQNTRSTCLYRLTVNTDEGTIKSTQFVPVTTSNGTYLRTPDAKTKASMLSYMRSLSPQVSIDREGFVTKKQ